MIHVQEVCVNNMSIYMLVMWEHDDLEEVPRLNTNRMSSHSRLDMEYKLSFGNIRSVGQLL